MRTDLKGKHLITTQDWAVDELESLFELAAELKRARAEGNATRLLDLKRPKATQHGCSTSRRST